MKDQLILAARRDRLPNELSMTGFHLASDRVITSRLKDAGLWLGPRSHLESDEAFRQIIPYIVLRRGDYVVCYRRSNAGAEHRLHGRLSLGLGGHIDMADVVSVDGKLDLDATLLGAAMRELSEELAPMNILSRRWVGMLVENDSSVGRVHLGVVGVWSIGPEPIGAAEEAVREARLLRVEEASNFLGEFESWSAFLLPDLQAGVI